MTNRLSTRRMGEWEAAGERIGRRFGEKVGRAVGRWLGERLPNATGQTSTEEPTGDAENGRKPLSDVPNTRKELEERSYRELQSLAKAADVRANTKKSG